MRTDRQIQASRTNGAKSRGPVTAAGKSNSSRNAIYHGVFAKSILLKTESAADFDQFAQSLHGEFEPQTPFEFSLVENMIAAQWQHMRLKIMQSALLNKEITRREQMETAEAGESPAIAAAESFRTLADDTRTLDLMDRYQQRFDRQYLRSHRRLMEVQDRRRTPPPTPARPQPAPIIPIRTQPETTAPEQVNSKEQPHQPAENTESVAIIRKPIQVFMRVNSCSFVAKKSPEPPPTPPTPENPLYNCIAASSE